MSRAVPFVLLPLGLLVFAGAAVLSLKPDLVDVPDVVPLAALGGGAALVVLGLGMLIAQGDGPRLWARLRSAGRQLGLLGFFGLLLLLLGLDGLSAADGRPRFIPDRAGPVRAEVYRAVDWFLLTLGGGLLLLQGVVLLRRSFPPPQPFSRDGLAFLCPAAWSLRTFPLSGDASRGWQVGYVTAERSIRFQVLAADVQKELLEAHAAELQAEQGYAELRFTKKPGLLAGRVSSGFDYSGKVNGTPFSGRAETILVDGRTVLYAWQAPDGELPRLRPALDLLSESLVVDRPGTTPSPKPARLRPAAQTNATAAPSLPSAGVQGLASYAAHGLKFHHPFAWTLQVEALDGAGHAWKFTLQAPAAVVQLQLYAGDVAAKMLNHYGKTLRENPEYQQLKLERSTGTLAGRDSIRFDYTFAYRGVPNRGQVESAGSSGGTVVLLWQAADSAAAGLAHGLEVIRKTLVFSGA